MRILAKPLKYPNEPVRSLKALAAALRVPIGDLQRMASIANSQYRNAKPVTKADGTIRQTYDAFKELKKIQKAIQRQLLEKVEYPNYLTGSLKGRDARRNAEIHAGASITVCEDVEKFFPSTTSELVNTIWLKFFGFSSDVADLLTKLTTKGGALPQGAVTSSYLANLAFWDREPAFHAALQAKGIMYSRYVDDITISSKRALSNVELQKLIAQILGMMKACGFKAKRSKQEIQRGNSPMYATKLMVNVRAALPTSERKAIRAAVYQLEERLAGSSEPATLSSELNSVAGRVGRLKQMHPTKGNALKKRVDIMRNSFKTV
jgi:Reverse transcriptase (RNA-dependent DNA polymerase)